MYERKSRLKPEKQRDLLMLFVTGATARAASEVIGVNPKTSADFYRRLRRLIASKVPNYRMSPHHPVNDHCFHEEEAPVRQWDAAKRVPVFGLIKDKDSGVIRTAIHADIIRDPAKLPDHLEEITPDGIVFTRSKHLGEMLDVANFRYANVLSSDLGTFDDIKNFWWQTKRYLIRFNGIKRDNLYWFLKECEWRFHGGNHRELLDQLAEWMGESYF